MKRGAQPSHIYYEQGKTGRDRERGQGHPGFCQGHRDTGLQRMENQKSQEGTEPGPRSSREEEGGGRGKQGWMVPKVGGLQEGRPQTPPHHRGLQQPGHPSLPLLESTSPLKASASSALAASFPSGTNTADLFCEELFSS